MYLNYGRKEKGRKELNEKTHSITVVEGLLWFLDIHLHVPIFKTDLNITPLSSEQIRQEVQQVESQMQQVESQMQQMESRMQQIKSELQDSQEKFDSSMRNRGKQLYTVRAH